MRGKSRFSGTAWVAVTIAVWVLACGTPARADENNKWPGHGDVWGIELW